MRDPQVIDGFCEACGVYVPMRLDGEGPTTHDCGRTPPMDNLPPNIYACPTCLGVGRSRWGCIGTPSHPHPHAFMRSLHELRAEKVGGGS